MQQEEEPDNMDSYATDSSEDDVGPALRRTKAAKKRKY